MTATSNKRDLQLILLASFFYFSSPMVVTPLITGFSGSLGASAVVMGLIGGLMNLCSLFCRPFVGNLSDKISKYRLTIIGAVLMIVAGIGYVVAPTAGVVVVSRVVNGIGFACCSVCMSTWMSSLLPKEKIGSGMGMYGMTNAMGMAIAPAIGVTIYQAIGYRPAFVMSLLCSVAIVLICPFIKDKGEPVASAGESSGFAIVDRKVLPVAAIIMLFAIPYFATQTFLVNYIEAQGYAISVSLFFPMYAGILFVLRFVLKSWFDKLPFRLFFFASSVCAFIGLFCLGVMQSNWMMFVASVFMAGGYGLMCSECQSTAILLAGEGHRGLANSTYYVGFDLGMALGPMIGGFLFGHVSLGWFYPLLMLSVPLGIVVYMIGRRYTAI